MWGERERFWKCVENVLEMFLEMFKRRGKQKLSGTRVVYILEGKGCVKFYTFCTMPNECYWLIDERIKGWETRAERLGLPPVEIMMFCNNNKRRKQINVVCCSHRKLLVWWLVWLEKRTLEICHSGMNKDINFAMTFEMILFLGRSKLKLVLRLCTF